MRVVITGATSMIGAALVRECVRNRTEVLAIVRRHSNRLSRLPQSDLVRVVTAELSALQDVEAAHAYDVFYHFAWADTGREYRDDPCRQEENIAYTLQAVNLAQRLGCKKFIGAGSQAEYGPVHGVITPDTPVHPQTAYGMAKLSANLLSRRLCEQLGMVHIWGRIFSVYGRYDNHGTMLNYAIGQFLKGEAAEFSSAAQMWNYLHEDDAGCFFYRLGERDAPAGIYCIASDHSMPLRKYIELLSKSFGGDPECRFASDETNTPAGLQADISATIRAAGFRPEVDFAAGIRDMIAFKRAELCK